MDTNIKRMIDRGAAYGIGNPQMIGLLEIAILDWDPYQKWVIFVTKASVPGPDFYYKCLNCTGMINQTSDLPTATGKVKGQNFMVGTMPLTFTGNATLMNSTLTNTTMLAYTRSTAGCESIVNEIFKNYCVVGVVCAAIALKAQTYAGPLMGPTKQYYSQTVNDVDQLQDIQVWADDQCHDATDAIVPPDDDSNSKQSSWTLSI